MTGVLESNRCYFCGGKLEYRVTTIPFVVGPNIVVVKNVPAHVCTQCSEPIMGSEVANTVDRLLKQAHRSGFELSIVTYAHPAEALA